MVMQQVGVRAVVEGSGRYVADANRVNDSTARIGRTATTTARQTTSLSDSLRASGARMREAGAQAVLLGSALAAPGILAARSAAQLETSFTQIETLVGVAREQVDQFKESVFELSGETARSPQELANALFVVTSAGIRGSEAMDVLAAAAKGAASGLGDTATIARTVTSSVQAFADQNLTAEAATDVLLATVREGNLVASDLAGSLSRVLGPAAQLGVQFADLGGFVATFTRLGGDSAEATTALRGIFATLIKPTSGAAAALDEVGLSIAGLRTQIQEQGLAQTLVTLIDSFEGNDEALAQVIPNIRALTGVLNTAGVQGDEFVRIQESIRDSLGAVDAAFERTRQDVAFKFTAALNDLKVEMLKLGSDVLPILSSFVDLLGIVVGAFGKLPGPVKAVVVSLVTLSGIVIAVAGAIGILAGSALALIAVFPIIAVGAGAAATAIGAFTIAALPVIGIVAGVALGVGALVVAFNALKPAQSAVAAETANVRKEIEDLRDQLKAINEEEKEAIRLAEEKQRLDAAGVDVSRGVEAAQRDRSRALAEAFAALGDNLFQQNAFIDSLEREDRELLILGQTEQERLRLLGEILRATEDETEALGVARGAVDSFAAAQDGMASATGAATDALNLQIDALSKQRAQQNLNALAEGALQNAISDAITEGAGRGDPASFTGGGLGLLTPSERAAIQESEQEFARNQGAGAAVSAGGGARSPFAATADRQLREQIEAFALGGEAGLQKTIRTQQQLDREFARFAETLRSRFGVQVPEIFRDMFDDIRKKALEAGQEVPNDLGNLLSFLVARRLGRGLPGGAGLISVPPAAAAAAGGAGGGQTIEIGQINVGAGTTTGDIAQGVGTAARSTFGSLG